jgi:hypothetical protein
LFLCFYVLMFLARLRKWSCCSLCYAESSCSRQRKHDQVEIEDTKGVIRIRKSKKDRQHNGKKKKDKKTNNEQQSKNIKT